MAGLKVQRWEGITLEREKWRQLSSTVFVSPVDASLDRTFTLRPASYRLPFSKKEGHRKWLMDKKSLTQFFNCGIYQFKNLFYYF